MKLKRLNGMNLAYTAGIGLMGLLLIALSCNDNNKTVNNTIKEPVPEVVVDDSGAAEVPDTVSGRTSTMGRRGGKISITPISIDRSSTMKTDDMGFYNHTETAPAFPGGQSSLEKYIMNNIQYPDEAIENEVEGTVYVMFTIDENGKVGNAKASATNFGYGLEEEAVRVVKSMSAWTPGTNKGKNVKAWYTIPITYKLES